MCCPLDFVPWRRNLRQHLAEGLTQVCPTQRQALDAVNDAVRQPPVALPDGAVAVPVPRRATWLGLRRETKRTTAEAQQLPAWRAQQAEIVEAVDLAPDCAQLVCQH